MGKTILQIQNFEYRAFLFEFNKLLIFFFQRREKAETKNIFTYYLVLFLQILFGVYLEICIDCVSAMLKKAPAPRSGQSV